MFRKEIGTSQGRCRIVVSHPTLGILAVGASIEPAQFATIRDEIELRALPEAETAWDPSGPFATVEIPFPAGWTPDTDLSAPLHLFSESTSREEASRRAIAFNTAAMQRGRIDLWAVVRSSTSGARLLLVSITDCDWKPDSPCEFPPHARATYLSQREARRQARAINAPWHEGRLPTTWAIVIRHPAEDVHAFHLTGQE